MARKPTPKECIRDLIEAICQVLRSRNNDERQTTMNIQSHTHEFAPMDHSHQHPSPTHHDPIGQLLSPMLKGVQGGLSSIPPETLRENLQPVLNALAKLDAELLLDLELAEHGPILKEGQCCRPIYHDVQPSIRMNDTSSGHSCVRYLHISEVPDQYSIGIFVFAPHARIPLHDHPEMCVLSRVLYGDLQRLSLDLAREDENSMSIDSDRNRSSSWLGGWLSKMDSFRHKFPKGTKQAFKNHVDHLQAPGVTALYPYEGNLHEFVAGPHGAAVLDVLLPPYDNIQNRDCTFYEIHNMTSSWPKPSGKEPCFIVPTGQPENFHCISGQYRDLGESEDYET